MAEITQVTLTNQDSESMQVTLDTDGHLVFTIGPEEFYLAFNRSAELIEAIGILGKDVDL